MLTSVFIFLLIIIIIVLLLLLLAILLFECEMLLFYKYEKNINNLHVIFKIGKIALKKYEIKFNKPAAKKRRIKRKQRIPKYLLRGFNTKLVTSELNIKIIEGTGDAAYTAIIYGVLYFVAEIIKVIFEKNTNLYKDNIEIMCDFNKKIFSVDISCIFRLKLVNIISEGFKIYRMKKNNDKAGDINGWTSYFILNGYSYA